MKKQVFVLLLFVVCFGCEQKFSPVKEGGFKIEATDGDMYEVINVIVGHKKEGKK